MRNSAKPTRTYFCTSWCVRWKHAARPDFARVYHILLPTLHERRFFLSRLPFPLKSLSALLPLSLGPYWIDNPRWSSEMPLGWRQPTGMETTHEPPTKSRKTDRSRTHRRRPMVDSWITPSDGAIPSLQDRFRITSPQSNN